MAATQTPVRHPGPRTAAAPEPPADTPDTHDRPDTGRPGRRIAGIDAARGLALLGMMADHALYVVDAQGDPTWVGLVATGNAAALFAVLAGAGIAFTTGRARVRGGRDVRRTAAALLARAAVIGLIGLAVGGATDPGSATVILAYYAVLFVLAVPLVLLPTPVLVGTAVLGAGGLPVLSQVTRAHLPAPRLDNPTFAWLLDDPVGLLRELLLTGLYPSLSWVPYLAAGLALGRLRLRSARVAAVLTAGGAGLAASATGVSTLLLGPGGGLARIEAASAATGMDPDTLHEFLAAGPDGTTPTSTWWWLAVDSPHSSTPLDLARTTGIALAVIGVMLALDIARRPSLRTAATVVRAPLAAAGAMTLTFYTLHVLFLSSPVDVYTPETGYVVQVVAVLLLGLAWRATAGRGPLETLASAAGSRAARLAGG